MLADELAVALTMLASAPEVGPRYRRAGVPGLRRFLLDATRYHVYYVFDDASDEVVVLAIWSGLRGSGPRLRQ